MAGDQIGHKVLLLVKRLVDAAVFFTERIIYLPAGLAHDGQDFRAHMLWRDLELTADMILA